MIYFLLLVSAQDNATSTDDVVSSSNSTSDAANATSADSDDSEAVVSTESTSTTTIAPLDVKCQCLGDSELLAKKENTRKVLEICRNNAKARITVDGLGYVAERYRYGKLIEMKSLALYRAGAAVGHQAILAGPGTHCATAHRRMGRRA